MNPVAAILDFLVLYRYSLILALAASAGLCFFMACCAWVEIPAHKAAPVALGAIVYSLLLGRLIYWYGRPDSFPSLLAALSCTSTDSFALAGAFAGCALSVLVHSGAGTRRKTLDCMSLAGCGAIALGRLGSFFTKMDRGQILVQLTGLPWAYPVANASGQLEYRFATFLFQAAVAALLGLFLAVPFFRRKQRPGEVTLLFLLIYSASQVLLDSTRYDSLYLRSNGFISMVQVLSAMILVVILVLLSIRAGKALGWKTWFLPLWVSLIALLGGAGYMEYYVQRHGREAAFAYTVMGICLVCLVALGLWLWRLASRPET